MSNRTAVILFGAVLLASAAPRVSGTGLPAASQTSSSTTKTAKKKKTVASKSKKKTARVKGQTAPAPDRIKEIQTALQKDGSYQGEPTGKWDAATEAAMRKYQDKNGISPTGKIDAVTLNKLGLGSETAGKGAPIPAATPTKTTTHTPASTPTAATSALPDPK